MGDFEEAEVCAEHEIQIEDLGAPEKGPGLLLYACAKKLRATPHLRAIPAALLLAVSLIAILFLPGSSFLAPVMPASPTVSTSSLQGESCSVVVIPTINGIAWHTHSSTPTSYGTVTVYSCSSIQIITGPALDGTPQP